MEEVKVETVSVNDVDNSEKVEEVAEKSEAKDEIAELTAQIADLNDKYLRTAAELENTRRRATIDADARARVRVVSVLEKILPIADAVDAALKHAPEDEGIQSLAKALKSSFDSIGITRMEAVGKLLDPTKHSAIQVMPAADGVKPNTVVEEMQSGYMLGDITLRTAMVVVAK